MPRHLCPFFGTFLATRKNGGFEWVALTGGKPILLISDSPPAPINCRMLMLCKRITMGGRSLEECSSCLEKMTAQQFCVGHIVGREADVGAEDLAGRRMSYWANPARII